MDHQATTNRIYQSYVNIKSIDKFQAVVRAVELLKDIISKGRIQNLYASFNGGKDATVATFLMFIALKELQKPIKIKCLYFEEPNSFQEVDEFITLIQQMLNLEIYKLKTKQYQKQLTNFNKQHPLQWIVMGSRKDDPGCAQLGEKAPSDTFKGYPQFERINPIIQWSCGFLWEVIKELGIPYCKLYDDGYTSIGNKKNTLKNKSLLDAKTNQYLPAFYCNDEDERKNRKLN